MNTDPHPCVGSRRTFRRWLRTGHRPCNIRPKTLHFRPVSVAFPPRPDEPHTLKVRIAELERQVKRLELEREILKKATAYFASQNT